MPIIANSNKSATTQFAIDERSLLDVYKRQDYGYNIFVGENFYMNHNCVILDGAKVEFGDNVFIAPNCSFYTKCRNNVWD